MASPECVRRHFWTTSETACKSLSWGTELKNPTKSSLMQPNVISAGVACKKVWSFCHICGVDSCPAVCGHCCCNIESIALDTAFSSLPWNDWKYEINVRPLSHCFFCASEKWIRKGVWPSSWNPRRILKVTSAGRPCEFSPLPHLVAKWWVETVTHRSTY